MPEGEGTQMLSESAIEEINACLARGQLVEVTEYGVVKVTGVEGRWDIDAQFPLLVIPSGERGQVRVQVWASGGWISLWEAAFDGPWWLLGLKGAKRRRSDI